MQYVKEQIPPRDDTLARRGMQLYRDLTREIASREQAILIDLAEIIPKDPSLFTDTVHFSAAGEQRVAAAVAEGLLRSEQVRGLFEGLSR